MKIKHFFLAGVAFLTCGCLVVVDLGAMMCIDAFVVLYVLWEKENDCLGEE